MVQVDLIRDRIKLTLEAICTQVATKGFNHTSQICVLLPIQDKACIPLGPHSQISITIMKNQCPSAVDPNLIPNTQVAVTILASHRHPPLIFHRKAICNSKLRKPLVSSLNRSTVSDQFNHRPQPLKLSIGI